MTVGWHGKTWPERIRASAYGPKPLTPSTLRILDVLWLCGPLRTSQLTWRIRLVKMKDRLSEMARRGLVDRIDGEWAITVAGFLRLEAGR